MAPFRLLALDLGAESGRAVVGAFDGSTLTLEEVHRFPNIPVRLRDTLYWDFPRLFGEVQNGIRAARTHGQLASAGVDTWGVDFGLIDSRGRLLSNPVHYRDMRTHGMLEKALASVPREAIYATTGIQFIAINTLYQLMSLVESADPNLGRANCLLLMADLVNYFLCDRAVAEYTNATTTQCLDVYLPEPGHPSCFPDWESRRACFRRWLRPGSGSADCEATLTPTSRSLRRARTTLRPPSPLLPCRVTATRRISARVRGHCSASSCGTRC